MSIRNFIYSLFNIETFDREEMFNDLCVIIAAVKSSTTDEQLQVCARMYVNYLKKYEPVSTKDFDIKARLHNLFMGYLKPLPMYDKFCDFVVDRVCEEADRDTALRFR